jgi:hypothetical protein
MVKVTNVLKTPHGRMFFSILLGLGLAALFRKACDNNSCIVIDGPDPKDIRKYYYKMDGSCYKYAPVMTECGAE